MKRMTVFLMLLCLVVFQAGPVGAITLYDDFSTNYIKKSLWLDHFNGTTYLHERVREIDPTDGVLVIKLGSNEQTLPSRMGVSLASAAANPLTALRADVKIVEVNNDPTDSATVFGRIGGLFYNIYTDNPAAGCFEGDIWAELVLGERGNGLEVWFEVEAFTDCTGDEAGELDSGSLTSGITLQADHFYTLEITYNGDTQLTFSVMDGTSPVGSPYTFNGTDVKEAPPHGPYGTLQAGVHDSSGEYVDGYVHAEFDEVYVNLAAYDTFDAPPIDPSLWNGGEYVKETIDGHARLHARGQDNWKRSRLYLRDRYTPYLEATARMEKDSAVSPGALARVRIAGIFYNRLHGPGSYNGYVGDVLVQVALEIDNSGTRRAIWRLTQFTNEDASDWFHMDEGVFPTTIEFDTDYVLSINYTGTGFVFGCDGDTVTYTIDTSIYAPYGADRRISAMLFLDDTESGFIGGRFDNVRVTDPDYTNLSDTWNDDEFNSQVIVGPCPPDPDNTGTSTVSQNGIELVVDDDRPGLVLSGVISGSRILLGGSLMESGEMAIISADMLMSDQDHGAGTSTIKTTFGCELLNEIYITRAGVNRPPIADDQSITVTTNSAANAIVLTGRDPDSDPITFSVDSGPSNGTLSGTAPNLLYTPAAGYNGPDAFTFSVDDGNGGTDTGTVSINVNVPVNRAPTAVDQSITLDEDATDHAITLSGSDPDSDPLTFAVDSSPTNGTLSGTAPNLLYTPNANYHGTDSFTFAVDDNNGGTDTGTVNIIVTSVNDTPVADDASVIFIQNSSDNAITCSGSDGDGDTLTFALDSGPSNGTLTGTAPNLLYTPTADYTGADSFTFSVDDGNGGTDTGTVSITVDPRGGGGGGGGCFIQYLVH